MATVATEPGGYYREVFLPSTEGSDGLAGGPVTVGLAEVFTWFGPGRAAEFGWFVVEVCSVGLSSFGLVKDRLSRF